MQLQEKASELLLQSGDLLPALKLALSVQRCSPGLPRSQELPSEISIRNSIQLECPRCIPCELKNAACRVDEAEQGSCKPCDYKLESLEGMEISAFNTTKLAVMGKTDVFMYRIVPPGKDKGGEGWPRDVLVKIPLPYYRHANVVRHLGSVAGTMLDSAWSGKVLHNWLNHRCMRMKSYANFRVQIAIWRLARMCEVNHLFPEMRLGPVEGIMPESGYRITENGLFMTEAKGMTLRSIETGFANNNLTKDVFTRTVNSSQIVEAAIFDLLTGQGDRNSGNMIIDESGNLKLIDNSGIASASVNSFLLPSTYFHTRMIIGKQFMQTGAAKHQNKYPPPAARMDYRCHSNGLIGENYPSGLEKCMKHIKSAPLKTLASELGLETEWMLTYLQQSAEKLLNMGFEWTLANSTGYEFLHQKPCCEMAPVVSSSDNATSWSCGRDWYFDTTNIDSIRKSHKINSLVSKRMGKRLHCTASCCF